MQPYFQNLTLRGKLVSVYLLSATIPMIIISLVFFGVYYNSIYQKTSAFVQQITTQYCDKVEIQVDKYKNVLYNMVVDKQLIGYGKQINADVKTQDDLIESELVRNEMKLLFQEYMKQDSDISSICFLSADGSYCDYTRTLSKIADKIWSDEKQRSTYYQKTLETGGLTYIPTTNISVYRQYGNRDEYCFFIAYPLRNIYANDHQLYGVMFLGIREEALHLYNTDDTDYSGITGVESLIIDQEDNIISAYDYHVLTEKYDVFYSSLQEQKSDLTEVKISSAKLPWTMVSIVDESVQYRDILVMLKLAFLVALITGGIFLAIILVTTQRYSQSVHSIAYRMQEYTEGNQNISVELDSKDELYIIARRFNKMTRTVNELVDKLKQQNKRTEQAVTRQKKAEIKALEAQINPHFLYNTLDSINWMAIDRNEIEISDMLSMLGSILRYSVTNIDMVVSLEAELEWIKKYVALQRNRFSNSFDCIFVIDPDTLDFPIYKLLLQPFLENAILHGFEDVKQGGLLTVTTKKLADNRLLVQISDNGSGMDQHTLQRVRADIEQKVPLSSESIGISNVVNRLAIYYQDKAVMTVQSTLQKGTVFTLEIPYIEQPFGEGI